MEISQIDSMTLGTWGERQGKMQRKSMGVRRTRREDGRLKCAHQVLGVSRRSGPSMLLYATNERVKEKSRAKGRV